MILTATQIIIIISILFFVMFHIITMYNYSEFFETQTFNINNVSLAWILIENTSSYKNWWLKLKNIEHIDSNVKVLQSTKYNVFRIVIYGTTPNLDEIWTFYFIKQNTTYQLKVNRRLPKQTALQRFKHILGFKKNEIKLFGLNFMSVFNTVQNNYNEHQKQTRVNS